MKKILSFLFVIISLLILPSPVFAQNQQQGQDNSQGTAISNEKVLDVTMATPVSNEVQVKTQNTDGESQVQKATRVMEQLVTMDNLNEETEGQVRTISQEQVQTQTQIQTQLKKLESRPMLIKKIIGPNYKTINNLKQLIKNNKLRIQQFEELLNESLSVVDQTQIITATQALEMQNEALIDRINNELQIKSIISWLANLFVKKQ